ncbi:hypothetical protein J2W51_004813 [Tardiphaga robiniae]|jgi:hypothetical protein|uniref:hypothetical protein n=1 Tax=Tardiphaga robiniae TaxID=943830 RepID=UPI002860BC92|nr:hypothetical protein [Tardiphaga robiniae]MDR6662223.1 hypothetical protein [Tardiphaga robiniae]
MALKKLSELRTDKRPTLQELAGFPIMVSWFSPGLLLKLLGRVIVADVFGQYADRRLIEAALDTAEKDLASRDDISASLVPDAEGAIWIDFVADIGDGFDSTYAVAYLLAQQKLTLAGNVLPRGSALIMGGDEVYPTATRDEYNVKTRAPYQFAFPKQGSMASRPKVLAIPGNHDWYDGLVNFLAFFCREKSSSIGNWQTVQRRSYFGVKLSSQAWIWGIDIALVADMDQPQADYFVAIAKAMPQNAIVILCSAEPGWYGAEQKTPSFRTLSYAAWIAENAGKSIRISLVLSGDSHHYSRYSSDFGTQYITAGGGGAFLHGTHHLPDTIHAKWLRQDDATLSLRRCYPSKEESKKLVTGNLKFSVLNRGFSLFLGTIYGALGFTLSLVPRCDLAVILFAILGAGFIGYSGYQATFSRKVVLLSLLHAAFHFAAMLGLTWLWVKFDAALFSFHTAGPWWAWLIEMSVLMAVIGGGLAGLIFGINLMLTCRYADMNHNDAFSAMRLNSFRNFLRIRILGNQVTVYPVGLDQVPRRSDWRDNPDLESKATTSYFVPNEEFKPILLEPAIVIQGFDVDPAATAVKQPSELPKV